MAKQLQKDKQKVPHIPGTCCFCKAVIPKGNFNKLSSALMKHKWDEHPKEMGLQSNKGLEAADVAKQKKKEEAAKAAASSATGGKPEGDGNKKDGLKEGGEMASVRQPAHGAIQFIMGEQEIIIDPAELYDAFMYYRDMVVNHEIHDSFTHVIKSSVKYCWEAFNRQQAREQPASIRMVVPQ